MKRLIFAVIAVILLTVGVYRWIPETDTIPQTSPLLAHYTTAAPAPPKDDSDDDAEYVRVAETPSEPEEAAAEIEEIRTVADVIEGINIRAYSTLVMNAGTGEILYSNNGDGHVAPASTVKLLTALTALDYCQLDDVLTVGAEINMIASDSSRAWLRIEDKLTVKQLLVAMLLPSGNDAAYTLAAFAGKKIAGESAQSTAQLVKVFTDEMNRKAKELGAVSSCFTTPDGYDAEGQYTTAHDIAVIARECLKNEALCEITSSYEISDTWVGGREVTYKNTNQLLNPESLFYYPNAIGLKTGTTGKAENCLVSAAKIWGQTYICVVMGSDNGHLRFAKSRDVFSVLEPSPVKVSTLAIMR